MAYQSTVVCKCLALDGQSQATFIALLALAASSQRWQSRMLGAASGLSGWDCWQWVSLGVSLAGSFGFAFRVFSDTCFLQQLRMRRSCNASFGSCHDSVIDT